MSSTTRNGYTFVADDDAGPITTYVVGDLDRDGHDDLLFVPQDWSAIYLILGNSADDLFDLDWATDHEMDHRIVLSDIDVPDTADGRPNHYLGYVFDRLWHDDPGQITVDLDLNRPGGPIGFTVNVPADASYGLPAISYWVEYAALPVLDGHESDYLGTDGRIALPEVMPTSPATTFTYRGYAFANVTDSDAVPGSWALVDVGDVDGDGTTDFVIGSPQAVGGGNIYTGHLYYFSGARLETYDQGDGLDDGIINLKPRGTVGAVDHFFDYNSYHLGAGIAVTGDMNADGFSDFLVSSPGSVRSNAPLGSFTGSTFLVYGGDMDALFSLSSGRMQGIFEDVSSVAPGRILQIHGGAIGATEGYALESVGDVDGDGLGDIVARNTATGAEYTIWGALLGHADAFDSDDGETQDSKIWLTEDLLEALQVPPADFHIGGYGIVHGSDTGVYTVTDLGDVDGDGIADWAVGVPQAVGAGGSYTGRTYFFSGARFADYDRSDGFEDGTIVLEPRDGPSPVEYFYGGTLNDGFGSGVLALGSVNGDGFQDFLLYAPGATTTVQGETYVGESYLVLGGDMDWRIPGHGGSALLLDFEPGLGLGIWRDLPGLDARRYVIHGATPGAASGYTLTALATDADGDGRADLQIGGGGLAAPVLLPAKALPRADAFDGALDGDIHVNAALIEQLVPDIVLNGYGIEHAGAAAQVFDLGDIDRDGVADWGIGLPDAGGGVGRLYIISGDQLDAIDAADGFIDQFIDLPTNPAVPYLYGAAGDALGQFAAPAGDVNGDGAGDFLVAAPADSTDHPTLGSFAGTSYLVFGGDMAGLFALEAGRGLDLSSDPAGLDARRYAIHGATPGAASGYTLTALATDADGDGKADLQIGGGGLAAPVLLPAKALPRADAFDGALDGDIHVTPALLGNLVADFTHSGYGFEHSDATGRGVVLGDIDNDGTDDIGIGIPDAGQWDGGGAEGRLYVISGVDLETLDAADGFIDDFIEIDKIDLVPYLHGRLADDGFGLGVDAAQDVDGDGFDDFLVSAPDLDHVDPGLGTLAGTSWLVFGRDMDPLFEIGPGPGQSIDTVPWRNGDELSRYEIRGATVGATAGHGIAGGGDLDGDTRADLLIDAGGSAPIIFAAKAMPRADAFDGTLDGTVHVTDALLGNLVADVFVAWQHDDPLINGYGFELGDGVLSGANLGDVDGDLIDDIVVGEPPQDGGVPLGRVYFISGATLATLDADDGFTDQFIELDKLDIAIPHFLGASAPDMFGAAVLGPGDVDGDGLDDILVSAPDRDGTHPWLGDYHGTSWLITGDADLDALFGGESLERGIETLPWRDGEETLAYELRGGSAGPGADYRISAAGDTDGDGKADFRLTDSHGDVHVLLGKDLARADAFDLQEDGVIHLSPLLVAETAAEPSPPEFLDAYRFTGFYAGYSDNYATILGDSFGNQVIGTGNLIGDETPDFVVTAPYRGDVQVLDGSYTSRYYAGSVYVIDGTALHDLDKHDGVVDGVIDLVRFGTDGEKVYRIEGVLRSSLTRISAGVLDFTGDGNDDLAIGLPGRMVGSDGTYDTRDWRDDVVLLDSTRFEALDAADGAADGVISLAEIETAGLGDAGYWLSVRELANNSVPNSTTTSLALSSAGDLDGDGADDLIVGNPNPSNREVIVATTTGLASLDADGDRKIDLAAAVPEMTGGAYPYDLVAIQATLGNYSQRPAVEALPDLDGDGLTELIFGGQQASHLILSGQINLADASDGTTDGLIRSLPDFGGSLPAAAGYTFTFTGDIGGRIISAGDVFGDSGAEFLIRSPSFDQMRTEYEYYSGDYWYDTALYLVQADALQRLDQRDGLDGTIRLDTGSLIEGDEVLAYRIRGWMHNFDLYAQEPDHSGSGNQASISSFFFRLGDLDGDGKDDFALRQVGPGSGLNIVLSSDLETLDALDGTDGVISVANLASANADRFLGYKFIYSSAGSITPIADIDHDGLADFMIGEGNSATIIRGGRLEELDARDGRDGRIDLGTLNNDSQYWASFHIPGTGETGSGYWIATETTDTALVTLGDVDGDGMIDYGVGLPIYPPTTGSSANGRVHFLSGAHLADYDAADGAADQLIVLDRDYFADQHQFIRAASSSSRDLFGDAVAAAGDVDDDGFADFLISAPAVTATHSGTGLSLGSFTGATYLIYGRDLAALFPSSTNLMRGFDALSATVDGAAKKYEILGGVLDSDGHSGVPYRIEVAGDFDHDGRDDFLIHKTDGSGTVYELRSADLRLADAWDAPTTGAEDNRIWLNDPMLASITPQEAEFEFGGYGFQHAGAGATAIWIGDIDNDGINDLGIGVPHAQASGTGFVGRTYVLSGAELATIDAADYRSDRIINLKTNPLVEHFYGTAVDDLFGQGLAAAGDIDNDGYDDVLISAPGAANTHPTLGAFAGSTWLVYGDEMDTLFPGAAVGIGTIPASTGGQNRLYEFRGATTDGSAGYTIAGGGDRDGDGRGDLTIAEAGSGAGPYVLHALQLPWADAADGSADGVIHVTAGLLNGIVPPEFTFGGYGFVHSGKTGFAAYIGDVDHDGTIDIGIGVPEAEGTAGAFTGRMYFLSGATMTEIDAKDGQIDSVIALETNDLVPYLVGAAPGDGFGRGLVAAGDADGDGIDDFLVAAPDAATTHGALGAFTGSTYLVFGDDGMDRVFGSGRATGIDSLAPVIDGDRTIYELRGGAPGATVGYAIAPVDDLHGDGRDDLRITSQAGTIHDLDARDLARADAFDDPGGAQDGVVHLTEELFDALAHDFIHAGYRFKVDGLAAITANLGDIDNDGTDDIGIGVPGADAPNGSPAGRVYVLSGADLAAIDEADGFADTFIDLASNPRATYLYGAAPGTAVEDRFGSAIRAVGDADNDGFDDFLISAPDAVNVHATLGSFTGSTYLVYGTADLDALFSLGDGRALAIGAVPATLDGNAIYEFRGGSLDGTAGYRIEPAGDIDGDDQADLRFIPEGGGTRQTLTAAQLGFADLADGAADHVIHLTEATFGNLPQANATGYRIVGAAIGDRAAIISAAGDVDDDGTGDILISAPGYGDPDTTAVYVLSGAYLDTLDALDGATDREIDLANATTQLGDIRLGYVLVGSGRESGGCEFEPKLGALAVGGHDATGDSIDDILVGNPVGDRAFLLTGGRLADIDAADGSADGVIGLAALGSGTVTSDAVRAFLPRSPLGSTTSSITGDYGLRVNFLNDIDADGRAEVMIGYNNSALTSGYPFSWNASLFLSGNGTFTQDYHFSTSITNDWLQPADAGDLNGDGLADLLLTGRGAPLHLLFTDRINEYADRFIGVPTFDSINLSAGDPSRSGTSFWASNIAEDGRPYRYTFLGTSSVPSASIVGDIDGTGGVEMVIGDYGYQAAYNSGDGTYTKTGAVYVLSVDDLAALDLDPADTVYGGTPDGRINLDSTSGPLYRILGPTITSPGQVTGDAFGLRVVAVGDIDSDGRGDFLISAHQADVGERTDAGIVYLVSGGHMADLDAADGVTDRQITFDGSPVFLGDKPILRIIQGAAAGDQAGSMTGVIGDLDGDGVDELVIGAQYADGGGSDAGESYILYSRGLDAADAADGAQDGIIDLADAFRPQDTSLLSAYRFAGAGDRVTLTPDLGGDGKGEFLIQVGADGYLVDSTAIAALDLRDGVRDGEIDLATSQGQMGAEAGYRFTGFGAQMAALDDVDGDAIPDLLVGDGTRAVVLSSAALGLVDAADGATDGVIDPLLATGVFHDIAGATSRAGWVIGAESLHQSGNYSYFGNAITSLASAGDFDRDGSGDILLGDPGYGFSYNSTSYAGAGRAYVVYGSALERLSGGDGVIDLAHLTSSADGLVFEGWGAGNGASAIGTTVANAGDIDHDGRDDLLLGGRAETEFYSDNSGYGYNALLVTGSAADITGLATWGGSYPNESLSLWEIGYFGGVNYAYTDVSIHILGGTARPNLAAAGDVDGDGWGDFLLRSDDLGEQLLLFGSKLQDLDIASGYVPGYSSWPLPNDADGGVNLQSAGYTGLLRSATGPRGYAFSTGFQWQDSGSVRGVSSAGDIDGDGKGELLWQVRDTDGQLQTILIRGSALEHFDGVAGLDGRIALADLAAPLTDGSFGAYRFIASGGGDSGMGLAAAGDFDGDGAGDFLISRMTTDGSKETVLLSSRHLAAMDAADGAADGQIDLDGPISFPVCFTAGTLIRTRRGEVPVEHLVPGDLVLTLDHGWQPLRWIGRQHVGAAALAANPRLGPVRVPAGALGRGLPDRDLVLSPQHRLLLRSPIVTRMTGAAEVLVAAVHLAGCAGIARAPAPGGVDYLHLLFDRHEVVFANGAPAESLLAGPMALAALDAAARREIAEIFGPLDLPGTLPDQPARPVVTGRKARTLADRHQRNGKPLLAQPPAPARPAAGRGPLPLTVIAAGPGRG